MSYRDLLPEETRLGCVVACLSVLLTFLAWVVVFYVAIHFVVKYW